MDDIPGRAGGLEEGGEAARTFGFYRFGTARLMPLGTGLPARQQIFLQAVNQLSVLAMRCNDHAQFAGELQGLKHLGIIDAEEVFVREEDLKRRDAIAHDLAKLSLGLLVELTD